MTKISALIRHCAISLVVSVLLFGVPASAYAAATTDTPSGSDAAAGVLPGGAPSGPDAGTFIYNNTTGLWENDYYTYNPQTAVTTPRIQPEYTYNQQTGLWDSAAWQFQTETGSYTLVPYSVTTPPAGAPTAGASGTTSSPTSPAAASPGSAVPGPDGESTAPSPAVVAASLPASTAPLQSTQTTTVTMHNIVSGTANSGDATVTDNKTAGSATTGNASTSATIMNLLQSTASLAGANVSTFTRDIRGDVQGDIMIDPSSMIQPAGSSVGTGSIPGGLAVTNQLNGTILNDIDLAATSGSALVSGNRTAGSATTGNADAVANVLNLINSVVAANQSFLGVINIYGDFSGNILLPADSLNALLSDNGGTADDNVGSSQTTAASTQNITNNTTIAATSGDATVQGNKHAGNARTGDALTKLTILNLTGHQVDAATSLLVFVNVLGTWVGVIMDAPAGATAAALTGGSDSSATTAHGPASTAVEAHVTDNLNIINNISVQANSGDATVADNHRAGDATTGNATASANIVNVVNSSFSLSHWFGVLFINVFGAWHGNFGVATDTTGQPGGSSTADTTGTAAGSSPVQVFRFVPGSSTTPLGLSRVGAAGLGGDASYSQLVSDTHAVLAAHDTKTPSMPHKTKSAPATGQPGYSLSAVPIILGMTGLSVVGAERVKSIRGRLHHAVRGR